MKAHPVLTLKEGRERSLLRRHPWIFSGAVEKLAGAAQSGDTVAVKSSSGQFLAWAALSPKSNIRARVWSFTEAEFPEQNFFRARVRAAIGRRSISGSNALRLIHSEADGLPGLIVDRYGDVLVAQISSCGAEFWRETLFGILAEEAACTQIYERSDADVRELEGLAPRSGFVRGGGETAIAIEEHGLHYWVDFAVGQKTGFFLDQRDSRAAVAAAVAAMTRQGRAPEVLNCFCYSGGFSLAAMAAGAKSVLSVDSSGPALDLARRNLALNNLDPSRAEWLEADVFRLLRNLRDAGRAFDLIVLDPPKFAPTFKDAERASRGYKDINLYALKLLRPGGLLATFSCSGGVSAELFQKIVAGAAADAGVSCLIGQRFSASPDHPVLLEFPEGEYLKGLMLKKL